jgi:hypothetical protein
MAIQFPAAGERWVTQDVHRHLNDGRLRNNTGMENVRQSLSHRNKHITTEAGG